MKQNLITDIINKMRPVVIKNKFTTVEEYKRNNPIEQGKDITEEYNGVPVVIENKNFNNGFILSSMDTDIQHFIEEKLTCRCNRKDNAPSYIVMTHNSKNFEKVYQTLEENGYKIYNYRYWENDKNIKNNQDYSPFEWFDDKYYRYDIEGFIKSLLPYMCEEESKRYEESLGNYIVTNASHLLKSIMLYVNYSNNRSLSEVMRFLNNMKEYEEIVKEVEMPGKTKEENNMPYHYLQPYLSAGLAQPEIVDLLKDVLTPVISAADENLKENSFDFSKLEKKCVIFIDKSADMNEWLSTEILMSFVGRLSKYGEVSKRHIKFLYDISDCEYAEDLDRILSLSRTHNISFDIIRRNMKLITSVPDDEKRMYDKIFPFIRTFVYMGAEEQDRKQAESIMQEFNQESKENIQLDDIPAEHCLVLIRGKNPILADKMQK